jgi:ribosomal protein S20
MDLSALGADPNSSIFDLFKQRRDALKAMEAAVQSGDLQGAQQNLAAMQQDTQGIEAATGTSESQQNPYQSTLKTDLSNLTSAVQAGNIGSAQSALRTLQQDSPASEVGTNDPAPNQASSPFLNDLTNLLNSLVAGDPGGVESAATALQQDIQAAFGTTAPSTQPNTTSANTTLANTTPANIASTTSDPSQNSFLTDLQALIAAAASNNTAGVQSAAKNLAQDIQSAVDGAASGQVGGHHHHHHHHSEAAASTTSASTTTGPARTSAATSAQGSDGDSDEQGAQAPGQPSGVAISSALKNAQDAYELLMSFSQQTTQSA